MYFHMRDKMVDQCSLNVDVKLMGELCDVHFFFKGSE